MTREFLLAERDGERVDGHEQAHPRLAAVHGVRPAERVDRLGVEPIAGARQRRGETCHEERERDGREPTHDRTLRERARVGNRAPTGPT